MRIVIIEDEKHTAKGLARTITSIEPQVEVLEFIDSVEGSVQFFKSGKDVDLIFLDIELSDGQCFDIFEQVEVETPVIFTTSYNEYALKAFEVNSIDYLLKPIQPDALQKSIAKFKKYKKTDPGEQIASLMKYLNKPQHFKNRFLVKSGTSLRPVLATDVSFFYIDEQQLFLFTNEGKRYSMSLSMESLCDELSPELFFRINRQVVINKNAVKAIHSYFNATLKLEMNIKNDREFIVSRSNVKAFRDWIEK